MTATLVVPAVPAANLTLNEVIVDGTTSTQKLAVSASGVVSTKLAAGTAYIGRVSGGGTTASNAVDAANNANAVVKAGAGVLCKILVTDSRAAAVTLYDHATQATGTVLFVVPGSAANGTIYDVQVPVANGIVASASATRSALTISYS